MDEIETRRPAALGEMPSRILAHHLQLSGWDLKYIDIDMIAVRVVAEARRFEDGRVVRLVANAHSAYVESEIQVERHGNRNVYGACGSSPQLLGRQRCLGARHAVRQFCAYLVDNVSEGRPPLDLAEVKRLVSPLFIEQREAVPAPEIS